ncbi:MAG: tetratricopeptide repeat protein [Anaerolineae bacterium]|nr:tetratricopeptide repeat protein [Anaerolineae bacterium]
MYIRRTPLGQGHLTFRKKKLRYPVILILLYLAVLLAALCAFWQVDRLQTKVAAMIGPSPTPTPLPEDLIRQAEESFYAGDLTNTIEFYQQASEIEPDNIQVLTALAHALTLDKQYQEALAVTEQIILLAPEDPRGYAAKSRALSWSGQHDSAIVAALRAIEIDSKYALAHAYLAEAYTYIGQLRLAREQAELAVQLDPYDADVRRNYAVVLEYYGFYNRAVQQYIQALQIQPNRLDLMYGLGWNYRGAGQYDQSIATFREIMVRTPDDPYIYVELGKTYYEIRDDDAAQSVLQQAVRLVCEDCPLHSFNEILATSTPAFLDRTDREIPEEINLSAWVRLGQVYYTRRNYENALEILEEAIGYGEKHNEEVRIEAYYVTASAYYYLDRCELAVPRAKQTFDLYLERKLEDSLALTNILSVFVLCRDYARHPYILTEPGFTNGFPDNYEEPDVIVKRGGSASSDE